MDEEVVIRVENVYKDFILPHERTGSVKGVFTSMFSKATRIKEQQHALKDISFEIQKGEFFGIVGRNGSGKSTLLKILANIYLPTKGKVFTSGKLVPFIELGVGFNPELTGRDNVYLNGAILGFSKKEITALYDSIVEFAELERFMDQKLKNYSSGMQVRLAFSMAIRANADTLLIDEVLAVGDADFQRKCFAHFKNLKKNKKTVIFVSHNMDAVREYCDRAALINDNKIISIGQANKIATQYSKLFFSDSSKEATDDSTARWGMTPGSIISVTSAKKITKENRHINIGLVLKAAKDLAYPIIGYSIKNSLGQIVTGTNTRLLEIKTGSYTKGQEFSVNFEIENIFSDGKYDIDVALIDNDGVTVLDWWETSTQFSALEKNPTGYLVSPGIKAKVEEVR